VRRACERFLGIPEAVVGIENVESRGRAPSIVVVVAVFRRIERETTSLRMVEPAPRPEYSDRGAVHNREVDVGSRSMRRKTATTTTISGCPSTASTFSMPTTASGIQGSARTHRRHRGRLQYTEGPVDEPTSSTWTARTSTFQRPLRRLAHHLLFRLLGADRAYLRVTAAFYVYARAAAPRALNFADGNANYIGIPWAYIV